MLVALLALLVFQGPASAQTPGRLAFEVASIKELAGEVTFSRDPTIRGRRVIATASTLTDLVTYAYSIRLEGLSGEPAWATSAHFDIQATAGPGEGPLAEAEARQMMQALLAERFHLKVHQESQEVPVFALVVAKGGPKMKAAAPDARGGSTHVGEKGLHREAAGDTMEDLARHLSGGAERPVIDRTGLTGRYAYTLDWYPASRPVPPDGQVVTMFAAVQELGLKLEPAKAPMQKLIIDSAEKPSAN